MKHLVLLSFIALFLSGCLLDLFIDDAPECAGGMYDWENDLCWQHPADAEDMSWQEAVDYCDNLERAGHDDWRLPNKSELKGLLDDCEKDNSGWYTIRCDNCCQSAQCSVMFCDKNSLGWWVEGDSAGDYWTSTIEGDEAWMITFEYGWVGLSGVGGGAKPRCVFDK